MAVNRYRIIEGQTLCWGILLLGTGGVLLACSATVQQGAIQGLALCGDVVIPALFVFLCLSYWLVESGGGFALSVVLHPLFRLLFARCAHGGIAFLLTLIGGYPMGAATLAGLKTQGVLSHKQVQGMALFLCCPSPAFAVTAVGVGMLGSFQAGVLLWSACALSTLLITVVGCRFVKAEGETAPPSYKKQDQPLTRGVVSACQTMLLICSTVILFRVVCSLLELFPFSNDIKTLLFGFAEVTNGCASATHKGLPFLAAVMGFGGLGAHLQIKGILSESMPSYPWYFLLRLGQGALCYGIAVGLCAWFPQVVPTFSANQGMQVTTHSWLPSVALVLTCMVFLGWLDPALKIRGVER